MEDERGLPLLATGAVLLALGLVVFAGPERPRPSGSAALEPAQALPDDRPAVPDRYQKLGQSKPIDLVPEVAPDEERPDFDGRLDGAAAISSYREEFQGGEPLWAPDTALSAAGFQAWLGGPGKTPGRFAYPRAMVSDASGRFIIVDKSGRIQRFSADGALELCIRTPEIDRGKPTGLALSRDGRLLVADTHYARVLIYDQELELSASFGKPGPAPGSFEFVTDVVEAPDGRLYVTDYGDSVARVQIFSASGIYQSGFGEFGTEPGQFQRPMALAIDEAKSELYVADAVNHRIQVFDLNGRARRILGHMGRGEGELKYPYDIALDQEGRIWVAEFGNSRIQALNAQDGRGLGSLGAAGRELGRLAYPWGLALIGEDALLVLDSGNDRLYSGSRRAVLKSLN